TTAALLDIELAIELAEEVPNVGLTGVQPFGDLGVGRRRDESSSLGEGTAQLLENLLLTRRERGLHLDRFGRLAALLGGIQVDQPGLSEHELGVVLEHGLVEDAH